MRALGKYVPVDLVRTLYASNREPVLGGEVQEVSLLFSDIEGFTTLAERVSPDELARALGSYLEAMTTAIEKTGGTIDKFIGDAVMAVWNAPSPCEEHARRACSAALACIDATTALYATDAWHGLPPLFTRFGVHTGRAMVGHFGAPTRMSYTALGDDVNLAARLEGLCKQYGVAVLVSESVEAIVRGAFETRVVDVVAVKGKTRAVRVYELLGPAGTHGPKVDAARAYEGAFEMYLRGEFAEASRALGDARDDGPARVLESRCAHFLDHPPGPGWDGVYRAKEK
jgi:adenylate cyclase